MCYVTLNLEGSLRLVHPQKSFPDYSEIWRVDRGQRLMHDGMPYDPIQGQGHGASKVSKIALFYVSPPPFTIRWALVNADGLVPTAQSYGQCVCLC